MTSASNAATFRDPAGSLHLEADRAVRVIHPASRRNVLEFIRSPFYLRLVNRGDAVATDVDDSPSGLRLLHPRIEFPSYPWEWTPSQLLAAAELTLRLQHEAINAGWSLKDATPLNLLFDGPRPVLVDILSFEPLDPTSTLWLAYAQYIRTFLIPLVLRRLLGWPISHTIFSRDGQAPVDIYPLLTWGQRLSRDVFFPITLPALLDRFSRSNARAAHAATHNTNPEFVCNLLHQRLDALARRTRRAAARASARMPQAWAAYPDTAGHYSSVDLEQKREWLRQTLVELRPDRVLDVGANTGDYSLIAAASGASVVALERDPLTAERLYRRTLQLNLPIQILRADIARPTPATGWENTETESLLDRLDARFDLVLLLAVVHHLLLIEQVPLTRILQLCHRLTRSHLVLEWVPTSDPMYQQLLRGRDELYGLINEEDLLQAAHGLFRPLRRAQLPNGRVLLLLQRI